MTLVKYPKWDGGESSPKPPISDEDKQLMADYLKTGLGMGKKRDDLLIELSNKYQRSTRQIERYIAQLSLAKANLKYYETDHKQKIRELAAELAAEIWLPCKFASFIDERIPGDWFIGDGFLINISESGNIKPIMKVESEDYLYDALISHLETGGFQEVVGKIVDWKRESGEILVASHKLLKIIMQDVGKSNGLLFSFDSLEQGGFTVDFFNTLYWGAVTGRNKNTSYVSKGCSLWFGVYQIYNGSPDENLKPYRDNHIELMEKYHKIHLAQLIGKQITKLREDERIIRKHLYKFSDMDRVPGQCDLCSCTHSPM